MENKNIIFNHTLEQYYKKYRNHQYRLLKITKKEVEDFDKKNSADTKGYLLKDRKWWLINDTYYEIPKAPRFTWFRNLNAACQIGTCVLVAGVLATSITLPILLNNKQEDPQPQPEPPVVPEVVIKTEGFEVDKEHSKLELNKDSYASIKQTGDKELITIKSVKVGGKEIEEEKDWTFDRENSKVDIVASAMNSTEVEIEIETESVTTKQEWNDKTIELYLKFDSNLFTYNINQITDLYIQSIKVTEDNFVSLFTTLPNTFEKCLVITINDGTDDRMITFSGANIIGSNLEYRGYTILDENNGGHFIIKDSYIEYFTNVKSEKEYLIKRFKLNKNFYMERFDVMFEGKETISKAKYLCEPINPTPSETFNLAKGSNEYTLENVTLNANTVYKVTADVSENMKVNNICFKDSSSVIPPINFIDRYVIKVDDVYAFSEVKGDNKINMLDESWETKLNFGKITFEFTTKSSISNLNINKITMDNTAS